MGVIAIRVNLRGNRSLKEKRRIVRSVLARTQSKFNVSAAEVDDQDLHHTALLGVACVSNDSSHIDSVLDKILAFMASARPEVEFSPEFREHIRF